LGVFYQNCIKTAPIKAMWIAQMVRNEYVKFGRHVDRQVNYKILWFKVPNDAQTFAQSTLLLIGAILEQF
jgi:hypothetical protein